MTKNSLSRMALFLLTVSFIGGCHLIIEPPPHISDSVYQIEKQNAHHLVLAADAVVNTTDSMCRVEYNDAALFLTQESWITYTSSWMKLQGQERGPEAALEQNWNIQFWPDKKNTTGRKLSGLLRDEFEWTQQNIAERGVAVKSIGALEWLLFDPQFGIQSNQDKWKTYCKASKAISSNIASNSRKVDEAWQVNPWLDLTPEQWQSEYLALMVNQLDYTMKKLSRPLDKIGNPKPYFSESWRAKTSMLQVKSNVQALKELYLAGSEKGSSFYDALVLSGNEVLAESIQNQFENTLSNWPSKTSLFNLLQTKQGYRTVLAQYNKLDQLKYLLAEEAAIELGIVVGFNATDGD